MVDANPVVQGTRTRWTKWLVAGSVAILAFAVLGGPSIYSFHTTDTKSCMAAEASTPQARRTLS